MVFSWTRECSVLFLGFVWMFYILGCFSKLQDQILFTKVSSFRCQVRISFPHSCVFTFSWSHCSCSSAVFLCWPSHHRQVVLYSFGSNFFFWSFSDLGNEAERNDISGYHIVAFSYGASSESTEQKNTDAESSFQPPFTVPEQLTQNLVGRWPCCCFLFTYFICPDVVCLVLI